MALSSTSSPGSLISRIALICAIISMIACAALFMIGGRKMKIGYVRTTELVYGFSGMNDAHNVYEKKRQGLQGALDSLNADYQRSLSAYTVERPKLSEPERGEREEFLRKQQENLEQQRANADAEVRDADQRMTQGVLNQINSMAQQYGREHGFDLILATTQSGSILYGDEAIDLTKELLVVLNKQYNPSAVQHDSASDTTRR
jgi:outer membrane protein